jgi:hypothetical protein
MGTSGGRPWSRWRAGPENLRVSSGLNGDHGLGPERFTRRVVFCNIRAVMKIPVAWAASLAAVLNAACVSPQPVKEASAQQTRNLEAVHDAIRTQQAHFRVYNESLIRQFREAYISMSMSEALGFVKAGDAAPSLPRTQALLASAGTKAPSEFAAAFSELQQFALQRGDEFDAAVRRPPSETPVAGARAFADFAATARRDLEHVQAQLELLDSQIAILRASHALIDHYISIDATIDGRAVAEAAVAGANVDPKKFPELAELLKNSGRVKELLGRVALP